MFFASWELKTTVCLLFLGSCLGQEVFRSCERDYCYERYFQRRYKDPNDLNEWNSRSRSELSERDELRLSKQDRILRDDYRKQINENIERHIDQNVHQNHRFPAEINSENSRNVNRQSLSDVTRHLADRVDERRELLKNLNHKIAIRSSDVNQDQWQNSKQLSDRTDAFRERLDSRSNTNRKLQSNNNGKRLGRIEENKSERGSSINSENNQEVHSENLRQIERRYISRSKADLRDSKRIDEGSFIEREPIARYNENNQEQLNRHKSLERFDGRDYNRGENTRLSADRNLQETVERRVNSERKVHDIFRRQDDHETQQDVIRPSDYDISTLERFDSYKAQRAVNRPSQRVIERQFRKEPELENRRDEYNEERDITRRSEERQIEPSDNMRRLNDPERHTISRPDNSESRHLSQRSENDRQRVQRIEVSRWYDDRETQHNIVHRDKILRRYDNYKTQEEIDGRLELEPMQRRVENNRERVAQRDITNRLENNAREHHQVLRQVDDTILLSEDKRLVRESRNSQRAYEQLPDFGRKYIYIVEEISIQHTDKNEKEIEERHRSAKPSTSRRTKIARHSSQEYDNYRSRQQRFKASRSLEDSELQRENNRERDISRRSQTKQEDQFEFTERVKNSRFINENNPQEERVESDRHEAAEVLFDDRNVLRDSDNRGERNHIMREDRQQTNNARKTQRSNEGNFQREREMIRQRNGNRSERLGRYEDKKPHNDRYTEHNTATLARDMSELVRNRKQYAKHNSRMENRLFRTRQDSNQKFSFKHESNNFIEKPYNQKPSVFHKATPLVWAQGALLAYIVMKTLNGKNDLKNHIPTKLRNALDIICF